MRKCVANHKRKKKNHQLQMASTESFFITLGHGSPPKSSGATVTEHDSWPMQYCTNNNAQLWTNLENTDSTLRPSLRKEKYLFKSIVRMMSMAPSLPEASTRTFRCPKTSKFDWRDLLTRSTPEMSFWPKGFVDFTWCLQLPIHKLRLPFKYVCTYTTYFSLYQGDTMGISSPFFKNNQQVSSRIQPRARNVIPSITIFRF